MNDQVPRNVLIVEDDQGCIELLGDVMRDLGLTTIVADSVEGALRVVSSTSCSGMATGFRFSELCGRRHGLRALRSSCALRQYSSCKRVTI
jgi:DNA-binding NtrC family response regulator